MKKLLLLVLGLLGGVSAYAQTPVGPGSPSHFIGPMPSPIGVCATLTSCATTFPPANWPAGVTAYITADNAIALSSGTAWSEIGSGGGGTVTTTGSPANGYIAFFSGAGSITGTSSSLPAANVSGLAASATTDTTNAANISSGTLGAARLPNPSASTLGGTESYAAVAHQWINTISTSGVPAGTQPSTADISTPINGLVSGNASSLSAATGLPLSFSMGVSTNETTTGVADCATDVSSDVNALVTAGYHTIIIPAGCIYYPTSQTTPADVTIIGEDPRSSVIAVTSPGTTNLNAGAYSRIENIGVISKFCQVSASPQSTAKTCVVGDYYNQSDSTVVMANWQGQGWIQYCGPTYTSPDGSASVATDTPCMSITQSAVGSDGIYAASANTTGSGTSAIRLNIEGLNDNGLYALEGITTPTNRHYGVFIKNFTNTANSTSKALYVDDVGDSTGTGPDAVFSDVDSVSSVNTNSKIAFSLAHQSAGNLFDVFMNTTSFGGHVLDFNIGSASGGMTGFFEHYTGTGGTLEWTLDSSGNATAAGTVTGTTGGSFGTLSASSTVSGAGFTALLASPSAIGSSAPAAVSATSLTSNPTAPVTDAGNVGAAKLQSGVPFILTNVTATTSCTVSTTGALSSCATLPLTFPYALMYFPQGVLNVTASTIGYTAGWYYVNMTSATAGQACLNGATTSTAGYVSGSPVAITSGSCSAPTNAINSATYTIPLNTAITGPTIVIAGNSLGPNGRLEFDLFTQEDTTSGTKTFQHKFGSGCGSSSAVPTTAATANLTWRLQNEGYAKEQSSIGLLPSSATSVAVGAASGAQCTIDTTTNQSAFINLELATGATGAYAILFNYSIKAFPN